ncbi:Ubiquitin-like modifier HUB1 [Ophiocordyceps camponoti-floridani]|uniref:Ubiquitin-like modifier HUB1 n=1 Tax=Ophiocordyceps camponoti-floridani TaxID=2030778 RepID=A0A8H4Q6U2_9HYPO|nr:Ubiquitin-like modifier HUB1 [Ophiocordyceps camponoti-floridani]
MTSPQPRRSRSRSPARRGPRGSKGFRWKDTTRDKEEEGQGRRSGGYRDRSPDRQRRREGSREGRRRGEGRRERGREDGRNEERRRGGSEKEDEPRQRKSKPAAAPPQQEMIIVNVNDRLGTKSAIPCLPSDTIGQLKLMIAARIGRDAGQIMLRRQGERPFKDMLSLEDYGISNGVQLDLEVDTGD